MRDQKHSALQKCLSSRWRRQTNVDSDSDATTKSDTIQEQARSLYTTSRIFLPTPPITYPKSLQLCQRSLPQPHRIKRNKQEVHLIHYSATRYYNPGQDIVLTPPINQDLQPIDLDLQLKRSVPQTTTRSATQRRLVAVPSNSFARHCLDFESTPLMPQIRETQHYETLRQCPSVPFRKSLALQRLPATLDSDYNSSRPRLLPPPFLFRPSRPAFAPSISTIPHHTTPHHTPNPSCSKLGAAHAFRNPFSSFSPLEYHPHHTSITICSCSPPVSQARPQRRCSILAS